MLSISITKTLYWNMAWEAIFATPDSILSSSWQNNGFAQQLPHRLLPSLRNYWPIGDRWIQNHLCSIIEPIVFRNFAHTSGGSMGSPTTLTTLTNHSPSGYFFLPRWPHFLLFWLPEEVVWGSGPELSLPSSSSSVAFAGWLRRLLLPVGGSYMDHTIQQLITRSCWKWIINAR